MFKFVMDFVISARLTLGKKCAIILIVNRKKLVKLLGKTVISDIRIK